MTEEVRAPIPRSPSSNKEGRWEHTDEAPYHCAVCGLGCRNPKYYLIMTGGGLEMAKPGTENHNDPGFMGYYPVGAECYRTYNNQLTGFVLTAKQAGMDTTPISKVEH